MCVRARIVCALFIIVIVVTWKEAREEVEKTNFKTVAFYKMFTSVQSRIFLVSVSVIRRANAYIPKEGIHGIVKLSTKIAIAVVLFHVRSLCSCSCFLLSFFFCCSFTYYCHSQNVCMCMCVYVNKT